MHERTQRAVARLMFVFCCAVPTSITLACLLVTWTPWYHRRALASLQTQLGQETGLVVELGDFRRPAPDTWHLTKLRLLDPETRREVVRVREMHWVRRPDETRILLHQPEVQSSQLAKFWKLLHDRFLCRPEQTDVPTQIAGNDLTIHSRTGALTLRDVDAWVRSDAESAEATVQCLPALTQTQVPLTITIRRDRSEETPATDWILDTQGTTLPCSAVAEFLPPLEALGSEATFTGTMRWRRQGNRWSLDLGGSRFEQIALDRLFEQHAHRLSGSATLQLDRCRIEPHQRRSDIAGSIRAREGLIGRSLLTSASQNLGLELRLPEDWGNSPGDIPYDLLAVGFNINSTQLRLDGICRTETGYESYPAGVVLLLNGYPLVQSTPTTMESLRLLTTIAPAHSVPVPLSQQTHWLTHLFPPPSRPLPPDQALPPRIRAAGNWQGGPAISQPR
jgi:hypothetical protein